MFRNHSVSCRLRCRAQIGRRRGRPSSPALRRPQVERIIKAAARINNTKAAGPVGRVVRDAVLPLILKTAAGGKQAQEVYNYHIDWDAPVTGAQRPSVAVAA